MNKKKVKEKFITDEIINVLSEKEEGVIKDPISEDIEELLLKVDEEEANEDPTI